MEGKIGKVYHKVIEEFRKQDKYACRKTTTLIHELCLGLNDISTMSNLWVAEQMRLLWMNSFNEKLNAMRHNLPDVVFEHIHCFAVAKFRDCGRTLRARQEEVVLVG